MPEAPAPAALADALREAIRASGLSYNRLASLARSGSGTITNFMVGRRDMTLAVASRLCLVLGFGLTRVGPALTEPLTAPPKSNRKRPKNRPPPASAVNRGQGRRVDLEMKEESVPPEPSPAVRSDTKKVATKLPTGSSPQTGRALAKRRSRQNNA